MVYPAPLALWEKHIENGKKVGLEMSVGKAYHHSTYLNINSASIHYDMRDSILLPDPVNCSRLFEADRYDAVTPWKIDFLNVGLFFGQHKVQGRSEPSETDSVQSGTSTGTEVAASHHDGPSSCVANLNSVLTGSLPGRQCDLLRRFLNYNQEEIRLVTKATTRKGWKSRQRTKNLFLPIQHGGCGVEAPVDWHYKISLCDLEVAVEKINSCGANLSFGRPLPGFELEALDDALLSRPWKRQCSDVDAEAKLFLRPLRLLKYEKKFIRIPCLYWDDVRSLRT